MGHEGLENFRFIEQASKLKDATLKPIRYFGTLIELYIKTAEGTYEIYRNPQGQESCRQQAWTAAAALDLLTLEELTQNMGKGTKGIRNMLKNLRKSFSITEIRNIATNLQMKVS